MEISSIEDVQYWFYSPIVPANLYRGAFFRTLRYLIVGLDRKARFQPDLSWTIEHWISNVTFLNLLIQPNVSLILHLVIDTIDTEMLTIHCLISTFQVLQGVFYWRATMRKSPAAIQYIDSSWNRTSADGLLYPTLFYLFGWQTREYDLLADKEEEEQGNMAIIEL